MKGSVVSEGDNVRLGVVSAVISGDDWWKKIAKLEGEGEFNSVTLMKRKLVRKRTCLYNMLTSLHWTYLSLEWPILWHIALDRCWFEAETSKVYICQ